MAPEARLLPIEVPPLREGTGDVSEAEAIRWAADHGADVICCAWAPPRGDPNGGRLPNHTRDALEHVLTSGRRGKGCVVVFAAGNDGCDLSHNGYASHPGVITVGACNHLGRRPAYSNWGKALWCVFPSNDPNDPVGREMTYLTTAPPGSFELGQTWYTRSFGFTSAACAAVAGLCALILSANRELTAAEVGEVLRDSCQRIDAAGGSYDEHGHSPFYGYGRPDPARAVALAQARKSAAASV
jgi:subtilisin family serine protease